MGFRCFDAAVRSAEFDVGVIDQGDSPSIFVDDVVVAVAQHHTVPVVRRTVVGADMFDVVRIAVADRAVAAGEAATTVA